MTDVRGQENEGSGFENDLEATFKNIHCTFTTVINASAAATRSEPEKISGSERDSNPRPLRCWCSALPTELSKSHESGRMRFSLLHVDVILGPNIVKSEN